jgi:hypothetical protein
VADNEELTIVDRHIEKNEGYKMDKTRRQFLILGGTAGALGAAGAAGLVRSGAASAVDVTAANYGLATIGAPTRAFDSRVNGGPITDSTPFRIALDLASADIGITVNGAANPSIATDISNEIAPTMSGAYLNLTATNTQNVGWLAVAQGLATTAPGISNLNWWGPNQTVANFCMTTVSPDGDHPMATGNFITVWCGGGPTDFIVDVLGFIGNLDS